MRTTPTIAAKGQGSNASATRRFNERVVLAMLRRLDQASKADLARHARLTQNAAGQIVRGLEERDLVRSHGKQTGRRGQPPTMLKLNPQGAYGIGVKVGRRSLDALLVDFAGEVLDARRVERTFAPPKATLAFVAESLDALYYALPLPARARVAGLGLATPYDMGAWGRELGMPKAVCAAWDGFDLQAAVADLTVLPVCHENDGTAATVAELFKGLGTRRDDFVYVFIGGALGGGVVQGGDYLSGPRANAGDFGLITVPPSTLASAPKSDAPTVLFGRASINALVRHLEADGALVPDQAALDALAGASGPVYRAWQADAVDALAVPLLTAARILDTPLVVVDGALPAGTLDRLIRDLRVALLAASPEARPPPEIVRGTVGRRAAALGAAILPMHLHFRPGTGPIVGPADAAFEPMGDRP